MLILLCKQNRVPLINIVRREEQVQLLKNEYGAEHVLNSTSPTFYDDLKALAKHLKAKILIECVCGDDAGRLLECLPSRSTMVVYGALSEQGPSNIDPLLLIGRSYKIQGWILG